MQQMIFVIKNTKYLTNETLKSRRFLNWQVLNDFSRPVISLQMNGGMQKDLLKSISY